MLPLSLLTQGYIVCAAIGSIFLLICAAMGATHHGGTGGGHGHGGHVGGGGHAGGGHLGGQAGGGHAAIGHSAGGHGGVGHGGAAGHGAAGHGAAGHSAAGHGTAAQGGHAASGHSAAGQGGHAASGHSASGHGNAGHGSGGTHGATQSDAGELIQTGRLQTRTGPFHAFNQRDEHHPVEILLGFLNPTVITTYLAFFGLTGLFCITTYPWLGYVTLAPALVAGFIAVKVMTSVMNYAFSRMFTSSAATINDVIGHMAEVTVPITEGRTGEVTYIVASKRYTSPARATKPGLEIQKGTKVMIAESGEKYMLVDLWTDSFMDPAFEDQTLTTQEKRAKLQSDMNQL